MLNVLWLNMVKLAQALVWIMEALHKGEMQHNDFPQTTLYMLNWEWDDSVMIGVCNWSATHLGEDVQSLWYANVLEEKLKKEKFWVPPEVFYVYNRRQRDLDVPYTKVFECYTVRELAHQLRDNADDNKPLGGDNRVIFLAYTRCLV